MKKILIEVNQPENNPYVILGITDDKVYQSNTLERFVPITLPNGITIKERGGSTNTRVIIKVGYSTQGWEDGSFPNVKYNPKEGVYLEYNFAKDNNITNSNSPMKKIINIYTHMLN